MKIDTKSIKPATIIRTLVLATGLINLALTMFGKAPLPFEDQDIAEFVAYIWTGVSAVWAWWKNNSITDHAIAGDDYREILKASELLERDVLAIDELPEDAAAFSDLLDDEEEEEVADPEDDEEEIPEEDYVSDMDEEE